MSYVTIIHKKLCTNNAVYVSRTLIKSKLEILSTKEWWLMCICTYHWRHDFFSSWCHVGIVGLMLYSQWVLLEVWWCPTIGDSQQQVANRDTWLVANLPICDTNFVCNGRKRSWKTSADLVQPFNDFENMMRKTNYIRYHGDGWLRSSHLFRTKWRHRLRCATQPRRMR